MASRWRRNRYDSSNFNRTPLHTCLIFDAGVMVVMTRSPFSRCVCALPAAQQEWTAGDVPRMGLHGSDPRRSVERTVVVQPSPAAGTEGGGLPVSTVRAESA